MSDKALIASLGTVMQLAFVPRDFDAAIHHWTHVTGVGPFFALEHVRFEDLRYRGAPSDADVSLYLSYWGDIQIELVQQHNHAPSIYRQWLDEGRDGLHHTCVLVEDRTAMVRARNIATESRMQVAMEARLPGGGEVIYLDTGGGPGTMLEVLLPAPGTREAFALFKAATKSWDGKETVRRIK